MRPHVYPNQVELFREASAPVSAILKEQNVGTLQYNPQKCSAVRRSAATREPSRAHVVFICAYGANTDWAAIDFQHPVPRLCTPVCVVQIYIT